jgi:hypothetical protein
MRLKFLTGERLHIVVAIQGLAEASQEASEERHVLKLAGADSHRHLPTHLPTTNLRDQPRRQWCDQSGKGGGVMRSHLSHTGQAASSDQETEEITSELITPPEEARRVCFSDGADQESVCAAI